MGDQNWRRDRRVIGVDPGKTGAIALLVNDALVEVCDMPVTPGKKKKVSGVLISNVLWQMYRPGDVVIMERVHSMPKDGHVGAYNFGENVGLFRGVLESKGIPYRRVTPQVWKREAGLIGKTKKASVDLARSLWPNMAKQLTKSKDGRSDAALIALYG